MSKEIWLDVYDKSSNRGQYYAHLFMFLLIFNEQRVPKFTFALVLTYYVKPHLFVILTAIGWFIVNIQSDLFWHRCVKGIIDDIIKTAVKTAEVDEQKTKYLQYFINKHDTIVSN
jgi:hypothetical protein